MDHHTKTYVRPLRRRWGFTQKEIAFLIGGKSGTAISRIERGKRTPNVAAALALLIVFDTTPQDSFPGLFSKILEDVHGRVVELYEELQGDASTVTRMKLNFLESVMARLESTSTRV
jgi:transcriptional regulator with XRE-family HTH domain